LHYIDIAISVLGYFILPHPVHTVSQCVVMSITAKTLHCQSINHAIMQKQISKLRQQAYSWLIWGSRVTWMVNITLNVLSPSFMVICSHNWAIGFIYNIL